MFPTTEKSSDLPGDGRVGKGYYTEVITDIRSIRKSHLVRIFYLASLSGRFFRTSQQILSNYYEVK